MSVYRFKVCFEDNEEVCRELEIKSSQTFEDFHFIILQSIGFDTIHNASFFISDDYWHQGDEISYKPIAEEEVKSRKQENLSPKKQMCKCKIALLIDDPHQKFVYVYDPKTQWTFLVELIKILPDDAKVTYPRIAKSVDDAPRQYKIVAAIASNEEEEEDFIEEDELESDAEAYVAHDDDEVADLKSEEGEEETDEELEDADEEGSPEFEDHGGEHFEED